MTSRLSRRAWLTSLGVGLTAARAHPAGAVQAARPAPARPAAHTDTLLLKDFQPRSMLVVPETPVDSGAFPGRRRAHASDRPGQARRGRAARRGRSRGHPTGGRAGDHGAPQPSHDCRPHGRSGFGAGGDVRTFQQPHPDRFVVFTEPSYDRITDAGYPRWQADELGRAQAGRCARPEGAEGRSDSTCVEQVTTGPARHDRRPALRSRCGRRAGRSVCPWRSTSPIRTAFFLPIDRFNERYEELQRASRLVVRTARTSHRTHELLAARDRVLARHPKTTFIGLARRALVGESRGSVAQALDRFPNLHVEIAARIGELGRQPRASRRFFDKYQDRILFGTDGVAATAFGTPILLPVPRNRRRVLRLRARARSRAGPLAHLRRRSSRPGAQEGLLGERGPAALALSQRANASMGCAGVRTSADVGG